MPIDQISNDEKGLSVRAKLNAVIDSINSGTGGGEDNTASNLGSGDGLFAAKVGVDLQFKSLIAGTNVTFDVNGTSVTVNASGGGTDLTILDEGVGVVTQCASIDFTGANVTVSGSGGAATVNIPQTGAQNLGGGTGIYASAGSNLLNLKSLTAGTNMSLSSTGTEIELTTSAEVNLAQSVGSGLSVYRDKVGASLNFRGINATDGLAASLEGGPDFNIKVTLVPPGAGATNRVMFSDFTWGAIKDSDIEATASGFTSSITTVTTPAFKFTDTVTRAFGQASFEVNTNAGGQMYLDGQGALNLTSSVTGVYWVGNYFNLGPIGFNLETIVTGLFQALRAMNVAADRLTSAPYTLGNDHHFVILTASGVCNLPAINTGALLQGQTEGRTYKIFNDSAGNITLTPSGSDRMNDQGTTSATLTLASNETVFIIASNDTKDWHVISTY